MGRLATIAVLAAVLVGCGGGGDESAGDAEEGRFDAARAFADLERQVALGPRPSGSPANRRQARFLAESLRQAGARDIWIQRPLRNVVGRVRGTRPDAILLAAHHDTKDIPGFVGANDGASGVAVVLELARSLPETVEGPSIVFALFDAEEARGERPFEIDGARGSRQFVRFARRADRNRRPFQGTPPLRSISSMVLFDLVGDCDLQIPREANSDRELYEHIASHAGEGSPFGGTTGPILDDHIPFTEAGVKAVDLIDFDFGPGPSPGGWWHTTEDTLDKVCADSLEAVGEPVLESLPISAP